MAHQAARTRVRGRELLAGLAAAQLAGEDFLVRLDCQRADAAGQQITPVPGLSSTTAAGLTRRVTPGQWRAAEVGLAAVTARMLALLPAPRVAALTDGPVTIDLDTTDVEVYDRKKRGMAWEPPGPAGRSAARRGLGGDRDCPSYRPRRRHR